MTPTISKHWPQDTVKYLKEKKLVQKQFELLDNILDELDIYQKQKHIMWQETK